MKVGKLEASYRYPRSVRNLQRCRAETVARPAETDWLLAGQALDRAFCSLDLISNLLFRVEVEPGLM